WCPDCVCAKIGSSIPLVPGNMPIVEEMICAGRDGVVFVMGIPFHRPTKLLRRRSAVVNEIGHQRPRSGIFRLEWRIRGISNTVVVLPLGRAAGVDIVHAEG